MKSKTFLFRAVALLFLVVALSTSWYWYSSIRLSPESKALTPEDVDIHFWYGQDQSFGSMGQPQAWINVLGNIQPASELTEASFSLNQGPAQELSLGGDLHRLALPGDFNVELLWDELPAGQNTLLVSAALRNGYVARREMTFTVKEAREWPLPYRIDFSAVQESQDKLQEVVQVVDGYWRLESDGVRTVQPYYDRVLTLGDTTWRDYEAQVLLTIHDFTPPEPPPPTYNVTHFGVALRWRGHHEDGLQPNRKWFPLGAQGEFLVRNSPDSSQWRVLFDQSEDKPQLRSPGFKTMTLGRPMWVKAQVSTLLDGRTQYRFKEWSQDEEEPGSWDVEGVESDDYPSGALCLVPHNTDVTIHEVSVVPISGDPGWENPTQHR